MAVWGYIFEIAHQIFLIFSGSLGSINVKKWRFRFSVDNSKYPLSVFFLYSKYPLLSRNSPKNIVFGYFLQNRASEFHVTWSETGDNGFKSFIGSIVSGNILILAILVTFWSKIHCLWWQNRFSSIFFQSVDGMLLFFVFCSFFFSRNRGTIARRACLVCNRGTNHTIVLFIFCIFLIRFWFYMKNKTIVWLVPRFAN